MTTAFLDNGVVLSYCLVMHEFHPECSTYIEDTGYDLYITKEIDSIYEKKKDSIIRELANGILEHQADIKREDYPDELGPTELRDAKKSLHRSNDATRFLLNWYEKQPWQFINKYELTDRLRNLADDIEARAQTQKSKFDRHINFWEREDDHRSVQRDLQEVKDDKEEDFWICIDAHDLAANTQGPTELATTDVNDFVRDGREELILEATAVDNIKPIGNFTV